RPSNPAFSASRLCGSGTRPVGLLGRTTERPDCFGLRRREFGVVVWVRDEIAGGSSVVVDRPRADDGAGRNVAMTFPPRCDLEDVGTWPSQRFLEQIGGILSVLLTPAEHRRTLRPG